MYRRPIMKKLLLITAISILWSNMLYAQSVSMLYAENVRELINIIKDKTFTMEYYFFKSNSEETRFFLAKEGDDGIKIWRYTSPDRKWQPVHNTGAFAGFPAAPKLFESVVFKEGDITIGEPIASSGGVADPNTPPPLPSPLNLRATPPPKDYIDELKNSTFKADYYFWRVKEGDANYAFLIRAKDLPQVSIYYLSGTKWQPIYNAKAFDGFDAIDDKTLSSVTFDVKTSELTTVGVEEESNSVLP